MVPGRSLRDKNSPRMSASDTRASRARKLASPLSTERTRHLLTDTRAPNVVRRRNNAKLFERKREKRTSEHTTDDTPCLTSRAAAATLNATDTCRHRDDSGAATWPTPSLYGLVYKEHPATSNIRSGEVAGAHTGCPICGRTKRDTAEGH